MSLWELMDRRPFLGLCLAATLVMVTYLLCGTMLRLHELWVQFFRELNDSAVDVEQDDDGEEDQYR